MSTTNIIHPRLYKIEGIAYWDDEPISNAEFDVLADHYYATLDRLRQPWLNRNDGYDCTGRFNAGGMREYEERI